MDQPIPKTNQYQVGGNHYHAVYQHWDWVEDVGLGYLEAVATKYLLPSRQAKKGGLEDLKKSVHYIEKLIEVNRPNRVYFKNCKDSQDERQLLFQEAVMLTNKMCSQANCPDRERSIINAVLCWEKPMDLAMIRSMIDDLMEINYGNPEIQDTDRCFHCGALASECKCDGGLPR